MSFCSAVWYHAVPQGSSIVQMTTGQLAWWRMKSLVLPSIVRRTTPTPRVPVTTNFGFSWVMKSEMACSGLTPTFSTRISTSIYRKKEPIPRHKILNYSIGCIHTKFIIIFFPGLFIFIDYTYCNLHYRYIKNLNILNIANTKVKANMNRSPGVAHYTYLPILSELCVQLC